MSVLPRGQAWVAHCGSRQRRRILRRRCAELFALTDQASIDGVARARAAVAGRPDAEYVAMHLMVMALDSARRLNIHWTLPLDQILTRFDADVVYATAQAEVAAAQVAGVRLTRVGRVRRAIVAMLDSWVARLERWQIARKARSKEARCHESQ
jgi:hypothetical protein